MPEWRKKFQNGYAAFYVRNMAEINGSMITFSKNSEKLIAANSGHSIHLSDEEIVLYEIRKIFARQPN